MDEIVILTCEDSLEGIFTGIYEAYALRMPMNQIRLETKSDENLSLFSTYRQVNPDSFKAAKVVKTLHERLGEEDYGTLCMAMASPESDKAQAVLGTVVYGLKEEGCRSVMEHLTNDSIRRVMELSRYTSRELQHLKGFLRFQELENDILFAKISPVNDILPILADHFSDRLPKEDFVIYDEGRGLYAIHPSGKEWFVMKDEEGTNQLSDVPYSAEEIYYQDLFCHFCDCISIKARENYKLQRNMLPLHYRKYMVEFARTARA